MLDKAEMTASIQEFQQAGNRIFLQVAAVYLLMFACIFVVSSVEVDWNLTFVLLSLFGWVVIGWCQFALFNALHEGLHMRFGNPHREFPAWLLTAFPLGFDEAYRSFHLAHHKYFGDPERDPDYTNYSNFPKTRGEFISRLLLNLCGWRALRQFFDIRQGLGNEERAKPAARYLPIRLLLTQALILALFSLTVGWFYYLWLWLIPLLTVAKFFTSTRTFCEHASPDNLAVIRTITGSFAGEKVLGVFCFHYHAEHHRHVAIPCNRLAAAHAALQLLLYSNSEPGQPRYELFQQGYFRLLGNWFKDLPQRGV